MPENEKLTRYDGPLGIRKSDWLDDWWVIGRAASGFHFATTSVSDADVEGSGEEMREMATAILGGHSARFKRCAASISGGEVLLWSPRNSIRQAAVPRERANELARQILSTIPAAALTGGETPQ